MVYSGVFTVYLIVAFLRSSLGLVYFQLVFTDIIHLVFYVQTDKTSIHFLLKPLVIVWEATKMAATAYIFSSLEKFSDGTTSSLNTWLDKFSRCCVVANKADSETGNVKGQLLMLFVEGRARAILEDYESEQGGTPQTYTSLVGKLKESFDDVASKEHEMLLFESRVKKVTESEEEYMLELLRLYTTANPDHNAATKLVAVKRKFLQGISPELRKNIFVFCNDPHAATVTREQLLSHCRKARNILIETRSTPTNEDVTERVLLGADAGQVENVNKPSNPQDVIAAINNLSLQLGNHIENTEKRFQQLVAPVNFRGNSNFNYNNYRSRGNRGNRANNRFRSRGGYRRGRGNSSTNNQVQCYRCHGYNHRAEHCLASEN